MSPAALVQNVLLGPGVVVTNITYAGDFQAIGSFTANGTNLGLNSGIVITTGTVFNNGNGPQGPNDEGGSGMDNNGGSSAILNNLLAPENSTFNAAVLEFDFVAAGELVSFNYVFGSEEYLEYVNAGFNDVFGLFISGPGIVGTQNIAKLPNGTIVSIDNVNTGLNQAFYVDNGNGNQAPFNGSTNFIQYDGFTRVLTASSAVQCGQSYHLIIAIADVGDGILDSGIFLEAESLKSPDPIEITMQISEDFFGDPTVIAEGCTSAEFTFSRVQTAQAMNVPITVTGTATSGLDYTATIPSSLNLAAGQSSITFTFDAILDAIDEPIETIIISFEIPDLCSGTFTTESFTLQIRQVEPIQVVLDDDLIDCNNTTGVTLNPTITGGLPPFTYLWSTSETSTSIDVNPAATTNYSVTVTDFCLNSTGTDDAIITVPLLVPIVINPIPDILELCPFISHIITPVVSGGASAYVYQWKRNNQIIGTNPTITVTPGSTTVYELTVSDLCGASTSISFTYNIIAIILIPEINSPEIICPGDSVLLTASATLGFGQYSYIWDHSGETSSDVWVKPLTTTLYTVRISDACQTYSLPKQTTVPVHIPVAAFTVNSENFELGSAVNFTNFSVQGQSYIWDLGNGNASTLTNPSTVYGEIGEFTVTLISTDIFGCIDTTFKKVFIGHSLYIPNTFTPDGNRFNNYFFPQGVNFEVIEFRIYNRWGEIIFEAFDNANFKWNGEYNGKPCPDGTYPYTIRYKANALTEYIKNGHVNLLR
jgi:gliding motility-associated-like protein